VREIVIACGDYDRTAGFVRRTISLDGAPYQFLPLTPAETFWRMHQYAEFDVCEMSLGSYCTGVGQGDTRFVALPIFPSRAFRHGNLFVREGSDIEHPSQLKGRRVGVAEYEMTAAVWIRGFLHDDYGVDARDVEWVIGRQEKKSGIPYDPAIRVTYQGDVDLDAALAEGKIDAVATAILSPRLGKGVRRLFADYSAIEEDYFRRTRIFPIMHTLVMKKEVHDEFPWLARSLTKAFTQAKEAAQAHMYRTNALPYAMPWMVPLIERTRELMGNDPWPYGLEENCPTLDAFVRHLEQQSLTRERLDVQSVFLPGKWTNQHR
jgi:4,5-dihydroxyphthalate decarboxylase